MTSYFYSIHHPLRLFLEWLRPCLRGAISKDASRGCGRKPHDAPFCCTWIRLNGADRARKRKRSILHDSSRLLLAYQWRYQPSLNPLELLDGILVSKSARARLIEALISRLRAWIAEQLDRPRKKHECGSNASGLCTCASVPVFRVFVALARENCALISLVINVNEISARVLPMRFLVRVRSWHILYGINEGVMDRETRKNQLNDAVFRIQFVSSERNARPLVRRRRMIEDDRDQFEGMVSSTINRVARVEWSLVFEELTEVFVRWP